MLYGSINLIPAIRRSNTTNNTLSESAARTYGTAADDRKETPMPRRKIDRSVSRTSSVIDMKTGMPVSPLPIPVICERIRYFRELAGIEQKELGKRIGISPNTISNWETGRSRPDINLIPAVCGALQVSLSELFGIEDPEEVKTGLAPREQGLLERYNRLRPGNKAIVDSMIDTMLGVQEAEDRPEIGRLLFYRKALSAGKGDPTEIEGRGMPIFLYMDRFRNTAGSGISRRADCVFVVNGDSMEPGFRSGDMVLVERIPDAPYLDAGEIGAFIMGNETYIKEYSEEGLVSLNPRYPLMRFEDEADVYLIGRVLGKLDPECIATAKDVGMYRMVHEPDASLQAGGRDDGEVVCREFIDRYLW